MQSNVLEISVERDNGLLDVSLVGGKMTALHGYFPKTEVKVKFKSNWHDLRSKFVITHGYEWALCLPTTGTINIKENIIDTKMIVLKASDGFYNFENEGFYCHVVTEEEEVAYAI